MKKTLTLLSVLLALQFMVTANPIHPFKLNTNVGVKKSLFAGIKSSYDAFEEGAMIISLGYGAPNFQTGSTNTITGFTSKGFGPIHAKFEFAATDEFGIGLSINHMTYTNYYTNFSDTISRKGVSTSFNVRFNHHYFVEDGFDLYYGVGIGYMNKVVDYTYSTNIIDNYTYRALIPIGLEATMGARYIFTEMFGVYAEVGLAKSLVQFGAFVKL